jgi:hypothetical protein
MATITLAVTPQESNVPPRVQIDVTDSGTPAITSVTVTRTDNTGRVDVVRTADGGPLTLTTSGTTRVGTLFDYEVPFGTPVTYSTVEQPTAVSSAVTVNADLPWLVHPGVPDRSLAVEFAKGSFDEEALTANSGVFWPLGSAVATVVTDGQRKNAGSTFLLRTDDTTEIAAVRSLIGDAGVLYMNIPPSLGLEVDSQYVAILDVKLRRPSDIGGDPMRVWECPYVPVQRPAGGTQSQWTWADVIATYPTWADLLAANATWADLQAPTF